eukprot:756624-Hanusia_phi.AAC.2
MGLGRANLAEESCDSLFGQGEEGRQLGSKGDGVRGGGEGRLRRPGDRLVGDGDVGHTVNLLLDQKLLIALPGKRRLPMPPGKQPWRLLVPSKVRSLLLPAASLLLPAASCQQEGQLGRTAEHSHPAPQLVEIAEALQLHRLAAPLLASAAEEETQVDERVNSDNLRRLLHVRLVRDRLGLE